MPAGAGQLVATGVNTLAGIGQTIYGIIAKKKAEREAANNIRPTYTIPGEEQSALSLAEGQAGTGMSDASKQAYLNNAGSGLSATSNAILRGGGDANAIGNAYNKYQSGVDNLAIYDDTARLQHLSMLQGAYTRMSAQKDKEWQINKYQPWSDKAQAIAAQLGSAQNNINSGISRIGSTASGAAANYGGQQQGMQSRQYSDIPQLPTNAPNQMPTGGGWQPMQPYTGFNPPAPSFTSYYDNGTDI